MVLSNAFGLYANAVPDGPFPIYLHTDTVDHVCGVWVFTLLGFLF